MRVDTHGYEGYVVPPHYDSLVAKLIAHGGTREEAIARMLRALDFFVIEGIKTTIPLHREMLRDPVFRAGPLLDPVPGRIRRRGAPEPRGASEPAR